MKIGAVLAFLSAIILINVINCQEYKNEIPIRVLADATAYGKIVLDALEKQKINFEIIDSIQSCSGNELYIICDGSRVESSHLPRNYIIYQSQDLTKNELTSTYLTMLSNAIAVWDYSKQNINRYQDKIAHYYYFPADCEYIDPILLPCILPTSGLTTYKHVLTYSNKKDTDISSHLPALFCHGMAHKPKLIVEAGIRGGESTIPLSYVALAFDANLIGIDIDASASIAYASLKNSIFLRINDLNFADYYKKSQFKDQKVDLVFIDTSHQYQHTLDEIRMFAPMLAEDGMMLFHDSNVTPLNNGTGYIRINGTFGEAYGNPRGVSQALKEYLGILFDEYSYLNFEHKRDGITWQIIHYPFCNGLTILKKIIP